nr:fasciclin domain-containing protein [Roseivirga misakiensis]
MFALMLTTSVANAQSKDIVGLAAGADNLKTLVAAVKAGGLVETLQGDGPFTVFAPTDEAFAALPKGTLDMLLKPENKDKLVAILTYHVVAGKVMSTDLSNGQKAATVNGQKVTVSIGNGDVKISGAKVIAADVKAKNGVVHIIDKVILPPNM